MRSMKRHRLAVGLAAVLLVLVTGCQPPPVRTIDYRRVVILSDSLFWGFGLIPGNPQLQPILQPMLTGAGVELRMLGGSAATPLEQNWTAQLRAVVANWNPDLIILASTIPVAVNDNRRLLAVEWAKLGFTAASRGADVWRISPPALVPGTLYDAQYSQDLPGLRSLQDLGVKYGAPNRPVVLDLQPTIDACPGGRTSDGLHFNETGQRCLANDLFRRITRREPPR